jgi:adenosylhomocysteine nucleosidase
MKFLFLALSLLMGTVAAHAQDSTLPVLVVSGMKTESAIAAGNGVVTVLSAGNVTELRANLQPYNASNVRAVVSFGVAGGLDPAQQPGQLLIPSSVVSLSENNHWKVDPSLIAALDSTFIGAGIKILNGSVAGEDSTTAVDPASRAALRAATGADIVDNESQIVAEFATANGLPFAVIRVVSDPATFTLPPAALIPLNSDGTPNDSAIAASIAKDPSQLGALMNLGKDNDAAMATLQSAAKALPLGTLSSAQSSEL